MQIQHSNSSLANQELQWHGTDSEELYQKNLITHPEKLSKFGWDNREFTYKFNSQGFRADEFDLSSPNIMFLGCSHTFGIGLPVESTWAHIVSTSLNFKNFNLGVGGASNDTAFRLAYYWIKQLSPAIVIHLSTDRTRIELHTIDNQVKNITAWNYNFDNTKEFVRHWLANEVNTDMNYLKNTLAIKQLCNDLNIKHIQEEVFNVQNLDRARDLQHFGEITNRRIAAMFLSKL
jgi:hypothetical protein